jgi:hypothetical protein
VQRLTCIPEGAVCPLDLDCSSWIVVYGPAKLCPGVEESKLPHRKRNLNILNILCSEVNLTTHQASMSCCELCTQDTCLRFLPQCNLDYMASPFPGVCVCILHLPLGNVCKKFYANGIICISVPMVLVHSILALTIK